jgi:uncharacterized protein (TIGR04551 family)
MTRSLPLLFVVAATLAPAVASAQVGPGVPGGAGQPAGGEEEEKPDGVAEAAPKTPGLLPTTPTLPPPKGKRNKFELIEVDGYFRMRADWLKNLHLSFRDDESQGGAPFPQAISCRPAADGTAGNVAGRPCDDTIKSSNLRLRLEPRINVSENVSVHTQVDIYDNHVLGQTDTDKPIPSLLESTDETDQIRVKRAWAEVQAPLGLLTFGRMPWHWGMGIQNNGGGEDPINGGYDYDADYGDTVDRAMFAMNIPGTRIRGGIAHDWPFNGAVRGRDDDYGRDLGGQPWDSDDADDVSRWMLVLSRLDSPQEFQDTIDRGALAINAGAQFGYVTQEWDYVPDADAPANDPDSFVPRDMKTYNFDLWGKLGWGPLTVEAEAVGIFGYVNRTADIVGAETNVAIRQLGGVGRATFKALDGKLRIGFESGFATGDDHDNDAEGETHLSHANPFPTGDKRLSKFAFDPDYKVDLILYRELIGAVSNAVYAKPFVRYDLTKGIALRVANVTSFALRPVATPGNETFWGTEFDADIGYDSDVFSIGLAYGVLFPLGAMNHPDDDAGEDSYTYNNESTIFPDQDNDINNVGAAGNAHTIQMRAIVKF